MQDIITALVSVIVATTTFFATKAKYNTADKKTEANITMKTLELFNGLLAEMRTNTAQLGVVSSNLLVQTDSNNKLIETMKEAIIANNAKLDTVHADVKEVSGQLAGLDKRVSHIEKRLDKSNE